MAGRTRSSRRIYQGRVVGLRVDTVVYADGQTGEQEVVEHAPVIVVAPIDDSGRLVLVRQHRWPVDQALLELPAGGMDPGESPEAAVHRELAEETGYQARDLRPLGAFYSAPGYCNELLHLFVATGLIEGTAAPEADEEIDLVHVTLAEARRLIHSGEIRDAKSIAGIYRLLDYLEILREAPAGG